MDTINKLRCQEVLLDSLTSTDRAMLFKRLIAFARQHYHIDDAQAFIDNVLRGELPGVIAIFSSGKKWVGFTRLYSLKLKCHDGEKTVFSGSTWHDQAIKLTPAAARFALVRTLRYKLSRPHENISYLATANTAQRFTCLHQINSDCEPKSDGQVSDSTMEIVNKMAGTMGWTQDADNPLIIKQPFSLREYAQQRKDENADFQLLNPHYQQGDWLIVHLPLDMQTIGKCLKHSMREVMP